MKVKTRGVLLAAACFIGACSSVPEFENGDGTRSSGGPGDGGPDTGDQLDLGLGGADDGSPRSNGTGGSVDDTSAICGDGNIEGAEECDDGNGKPGDGCSGICTLESGYLCETAGQPCVIDAECGNGRYEPIGGEACDDGNLTPGDGCDDSCAVESGWSCNAAGCVQVQVVVCGDDLIGIGETCEDGDTVPESGDGCSDTCQVESGYECLTVGEACAAIVTEFCGNGVRVDGEECDDGGTTPGDGCSASCQVEPGYACPDGEACAVVCGDSFVVGQEACDDGNQTGGDGCEADCLSSTPGYLCPTAAGVGGTCVPAEPGAECPNGILEYGEQCDDGNTTDADGCTDCIVDSGYVCPLAGVQCKLIPVCGDGYVDVQIGENCDDGNTNGTDGCDASCKAMADWVCPVPTVEGDKLVGGSCNPIICGDGVRQGSELCDDGDLGESTAERNDDGCLEDCTVDTGWICPLNASCQAEECGDGFVAGFEECDNAADNDGVTAVAGLICSASCQIVADPAACGNGTVDPGESCDDGDNDLGDGCGIDCNWEPSCAPPAACTSSCGDGIKFGGEECDDGNTRNGDGCSAQCEEEPGFTCTEQAGGTLELPIVYRDFMYYENGGHPAFQWSSGDPIDHTPEEDIWVRTTLGTSADELPDGSSLLGKPVFKWFVECDDSGCSTLNGTPPTGVGTDPNDCSGPKFAATGPRDLTSFGRTDFFCGYGAQDFLTFSQWYMDDPATVDPINQTIRETLTLTETSPGSGVFQYGSTSFFPIDGRGFGNEGATHNYSFTSEVRYWFEYDENAGANLAFYGDDDVWVFVNGQLVVDISGTHGRVNDSVTLDSSTTNIDGELLDLVHGSVYEIVVFQAERNEGGSNYQLTLSGFSLAQSTCSSTCGDGIQASDEQCDNGDTCVDASTCTDGRCADGSACNDDGAYAGCTTACTLGPYCGDGSPDGGAEECDDGANNALYSSTGADTCAAGCEFAPYCGDGQVAVGFEACDGGDDCNPDCTLTARCGDGSVDGGLGEACDDGALNGTLESDCDTSCQKKCGNQVIDAGEQCDPGLGNFSSGYGGCLPEIEGVQTGCIWGPRCGDGIQNGDEDCDDGKNDGSYGTCSPGCVLPPRCGDGSLQSTAGEQCDAGAANQTTLYEQSGAGKCTTACQPVRHCGDGAVTDGENCDDGRNDGTPGSCTSDCSSWISLTLCGTNGKVDEGEECDASVPGTPAGYCDAQCRIACGNGIPDVAAPYSEECDDGSNSGAYGTCDVDCTLADYCGDGQKSGPEECDLGIVNGVEPYGDGQCTVSCRRAPYCGDGRIDVGYGEECDGGTGCSGSCKWTVVR